MHSWVMDDVTKFHGLGDDFVASFSGITRPNCSSYIGRSLALRKLVFVLDTLMRIETRAHQRRLWSKIETIFAPVKFRRGIWVKCLSHCFKLSLKPNLLYTLTGGSYWTCWDIRDPCQKALYKAFIDYVWWSNGCLTDWKIRTPLAQKR